MIEDYSQFHNDGGIHIEDTVDLQSSNSDSDNLNDHYHITLNQVYPLIPKVHEGDGEVDDYITKHLKFLMQHKVRLVNKYLDSIYSFWEDIQPMEMIVAFDESHGDIDELTMNLIKPEFKQLVRDLVKQKLSNKYIAPHATPPPEQDDDDAFDPNDDDGDDDEFYEPIHYEEKTKVSHTRHTKSKPTSHTPIPPAPKGVNPETWLSWSNARRTSYLRADTFPNAYYYRHLPPGEKQVNGAWTAHEKELFLKRVAEFRGDSDTMNGDWGLFSLSIPGRVGYQCSNFYRKLVEAGEIHDSRYIKGADGSIHHLSRMHDGKIASKAKKQTKFKQTKKYTKTVTTRIVDPSRIHSLRFVLSDSDDETEKSKQKQTSIKELLEKQANEREKQQQEQEPHHIKSRYDNWAMQNPLKNMVDDITGEIIRVPALSPDGYVLDYNTWLNVLKTKKENPFTRMPVTKRQLVILTFENFDEYKQKIVNLNSSDESSPLVD